MLRPAVHKLCVVHSTDTINYSNEVTTLGTGTTTSNLTDTDVKISHVGIGSYYVGMIDLNCSLSFNTVYQLLLRNIGQ